jgi:hypothetical protein
MNQAALESARCFDGDDGGLILGEWLQPAGNRGSQDERGADEEQVEHWQDGCYLGSLVIL